MLLYSVAMPRLATTDGVINVFGMGISPFSSFCV